VFSRSRRASRKRASRWDAWRTASSRSTSDDTTTLRALRACAYTRQRKPLKLTTKIARPVVPRYDVAAIRPGSAIHPAVIGPASARNGATLPINVTSATLPPYPRQAVYTLSTNIATIGPKTPRK